MFWRKILGKKETLSWPLTLLCLALLIFLFGLAFSIVFLILNKGKNINFDNNQNEETLNYETPKDILNDYLKEITSLSERLSDTTKPIEEVFADFEQTFLNVSVPSNFRDEHLKTFLEFRKIEKTLKLDEDVVLRQKLVDLLVDFLNKINKEQN